MTPEEPKVTRARMIIELADGSACYYETREPGETEISFTWPHPEDAGSARDALVTPRLACPESVTLMIKGAPPWGMEALADSGEIPPELAERAEGTIDALFGDGIVDALFGDGVVGGPLRELRPYLARIAGRTV